jgi:hypothetical protein
VPLVRAHGKGCDEDQLTRGTMPRPEDVAHESPVHFRVQWVDPHPLGEDYPSDDVVLSVEPLGQPSAVFIISRERYEPFQDAVTEAIAAQAVY